MKLYHLTNSHILYNLITEWFFSLVGADALLGREDEDNSDKDSYPFLLFNTRRRRHSLPLQHMMINDILCFHLWPGLKYCFNVEFIKLNYLIINFCMRGATHTPLSKTRPVPRLCNEISKEMNRNDSSINPQKNRINVTTRELFFSFPFQQAATTTHGAFGSSDEIFPGLTETKSFARLLGVHCLRITTSRGAGRRRHSAFRLGTNLKIRKNTLFIDDILNYKSEDATQGSLPQFLLAAAQHNHLDRPA